MRRSSDYNDLLLKAFIRESFIQYKKEDLFERKNKNLISENKKRLIKEQKVFNEVLILIENFENSINSIILENSNKYSIKNILLEKRYYPNPERKELSFLTDMYKHEDPLSFDFAQETKKLEKMWNQHVEEYQRDEIDPYIMPGTTTKLDPEAAKEYFIDLHREKPEGRTVMQWMRDNKTLIYKLLFLPTCLIKLGVHQGNIMYELGGGEKLDPEVVKLLEPVMKTAPGGKVEIDKAELKRVTGADDQEVEKVVKEIEETSDKIQEKTEEEPKAKKSVVEKIKQKAKKAAKKVKEEIKKVKEKVKKAEKQPERLETQQQQQPAEDYKGKLDQRASDELFGSLEDGESGGVSIQRVIEDAQQNHKIFKLNQKITAHNLAKIKKLTGQEGQSSKEKFENDNGQFDYSDCDNPQASYPKAIKVASSAVKDMAFKQLKKYMQENIKKVKDFKRVTDITDYTGDASKDPETGKKLGKDSQAIEVEQGRIQKIEIEINNVEIEVADALKTAAKSGKPFVPSNIVYEVLSSHFSSSSDAIGDMSGPLKAIILSETTDGGSCDVNAIFSSIMQNSAKSPDLKDHMPYGSGKRTVAGGATQTEDNL